MDAPRPDIPDLDEVERRLTEASVEHDGERYIRASVASGIIGINQSLGHYWARKRLVRAFKVRIPSRPGAVRGEIVAWHLPDTIRMARRYWSGRRAWTAAEDDYLLSRLGVDPTPELAARLGRSVRAVRLRATELGVNARNAQGELTTMQLARLCGVSYCTAIRWCDQARPRLRHRRLPGRLRPRMIRPEQLREFFRQHPQFYRRRSEAARKRIDRVTMFVSERRKAAAA